MVWIFAVLLCITIVHSSRLSNDKRVSNSTSSSRTNSNNQYRQLCLRPDKAEFSKRYIRMKHIMDTYRHQHSRNALSNEAVNNPQTFCQRNFIRANDHECGNLCNSLYHPLSAYGLGVILNRTVVLGKGQKQSFCIRYHNWVLEYDELEAMYTSANCSRAIPLHYEPGDWLPQYMNNTYEVGHQFDYACYMDKVPNVMLGIPGGAAEFTPYRMFRKQLNITLGKEAQRRVDTLLSAPVYTHSHYEFMGLLFNSLFAFPEKVESYIQKVLDKILTTHGSNSSRCFYKHNVTETVIISMHIRHPGRVNGRINPREDDEFDTSFITQLSDTLATKYSGYKCILLLAADRVHSIQNVTRLATQLGCAVYSNPYPKVDIVKEITPECDELCVEQGPLAKGIPQLADLLLLSYGQHFIGYGESTYSQTIGYLIAYNILVSDRYCNNNDEFLELFGGCIYAAEHYNNKFEEWMKECPANAVVHKMAKLHDSGKKSDLVKQIVLKSLKERDH